MEIVPFLPLIIWSLLSACSPASDAPGEWRLEDGRTVTALTQGDRPTVLLVMDPADCFTCSTTLAQWLEWRRAQPERFRLLFTRQPTRAEQRRLRAVRPLLEAEPHHREPQLTRRTNP